MLLLLCGGVLSKGGSKSKGAISGNQHIMDGMQFSHNRKNWMIYGPIMVTIFLIVSCVLSCRLRNWYRSKTYKKVQMGGGTEKLESGGGNGSPVECSTIPSEYHHSPLGGRHSDYRLLVVNDSGCAVSHATTLTKDERV